MLNLSESSVAVLRHTRGKQMQAETAKPGLTACADANIGRVINGECFIV